MDSSSEDIATRIRPFAPSFTSRKVALSSYSGDAEGIFFCLQLLYVFTRAGINVEDAGIGRSLPVGMVDFGIIVTGPVADEPFVNALVEGIRAHLPVTNESWQLTDANPSDVRGECGSRYTDVRILVAAKPMPDIPDVKKFLEKHPLK